MIYSLMCFNEDWMYQFTLSNNVYLLELILVTKVRLDGLQNAKKYPARWSI